MATAAEPVSDARPIPDVFTIQGRPYRRPTSTTTEQDAFVEVRLRDAGIKRLLKGFDPKAGDIGDLVEAVILEAFDRGVMYEILGGVFVAEGESWTKAGALRTARAIAETTDDDEKQMIFSFAADVLLDFFRLAAAFLPTSPRSSNSMTAESTSEDAGGDHSGQPDLRSASSQPSPSVAIQSTTTDRGTTSSETSPHGT